MEKTYNGEFTVALEKIEVNEEVFERLATAKLAAFDFELDARISLKFLETEIKRGFEELNSEEVKKARQEYYNFEGTNPEDYAEKIFQMKNGELVMAGIRHFGGHREHPFIHILPTFPINDLQEIKELNEELVKIFSPFKPNHVSFGSKVRHPVDFIASVTMVSKAEGYRNLKVETSEEELELVQECDLAVWEWYEKGYEQFHRQYPTLKEKVPMCDQNDLQASQNEGLLFSAWLKGERIGLIAATRSPFLGMDGLYFNEIFLVEKVKGFGFGKALQRLMVLKVTKGHEVVWGTIDEFNTPSFKTALANGRKPVHYECFHSLKEPMGR